MTLKVILRLREKSPALIFERGEMEPESRRGFKRVNSHIFIESVHDPPTESS